MLEIVDGDGAVARQVGVRVGLAPDDAPVAHRLENGGVLVA